MQRFWRLFRLLTWQSLVEPSPICFDVHGRTFQLRPAPVRSWQEFKTVHSYHPPIVYEVNSCSQGLNSSLISMSLLLLAKKCVLSWKMSFSTLKTRSTLGHTPFNKLFKMSLENNNSFLSWHCTCSRWAARFWVVRRLSVLLRFKSQWCQSTPLPAIIYVKQEKFDRLL